MEKLRKSCLVTARALAEILIGNGVFRLFDRVKWLINYFVGGN